MTSSSDWERRFFFFPLELASEDVVLLDAAWAGTPLLLTELPLFVADTSPLVWAPPLEDDSPFCALFRQDSSESWSCPAPLACMFWMLTWVALCGFKRMTGATGEFGKVKSPTTTADRPADPIAAPSSPAPSATESRCFFRGGGDAPPVSESEEEQAEARVNSTITSEVIFD